MKEYDSPDNWIQFRLFYNASEIEKIRKLDQRVLGIGSDLEEDGLIESWHIRCSGPYISLRVKSEPRNRVEVENRIEALKEELTDAGFMVIKIETKDRHVYVDAMKTN